MIYIYDGSYEGLLSCIFGVFKAREVPVAICAEGYALRHPENFPVDINRADYEMILRVPGIGVKSAKKIISSRRHQYLHAEHLQQIGVVMKRARHFISCPGVQVSLGEKQSRDIRNAIIATDRATSSAQLALFG
jgi:predicted DNA-binding helix-hairpin-helix protein